MSSFNRRILLLSLAALAGCGFEPAYGPTGSAAGLRGAIRVADPNEQNGFDLVKRLESRLGRAANPRYSLDISLKLAEDDLAVTPAQTIYRYNIVGYANFTLRDFNTKTELTAGQVQNFTAYSASGTTISTETARRDAYERLMIVLADQIITRLTATSGAWSK